MPKVLFAVLLVLGDYSEMERLQLGKDQSVDKAELALMGALQEFPEEQYCFPPIEKMFSISGPAPPLAALWWKLK